MSRFFREPARMSWAPNDIRKRRPVGRTCPRCGTAEFDEIATELRLGFVPDRECRACGTEYHPPPPLVASIALLVVGGLAVTLTPPLAWMMIEMGGAMPVGRRGGRGGPIIFLGFGLLMFGLVGGFLAIGTGLWGLWQHVRAR